MLFQKNVGQIIDGLFHCSLGFVRFTINLALVNQIDELNWKKPLTG
jgi:hypothetical protein